ncbi:putative Chromosome-associated kinesin KIF4 [Blattamonas nauphoetae]|uniref:Kinesin-like protein n=1 Tax=Blattamonas nauphoetae TaxID=2049346 RepID=A0ABQ9XJM6_9EUKA|nr:putative Chromosome-associated kinesin KIF4 [Blattamonas nauphoetae]
MSRTQRIQTYLRVRPIPNPTPNMELSPIDKTITFTLPRSEKQNAERKKKTFTFDEVFDPQIKQDEVFERIGRKLVMNVLDGFNSTLFAYGQTGSGKTFSVVGGIEDWEQDNGLIPRCLHALYQEMDNRPDFVWSVQISYLEIYEGSGIDLLSQEETKPKVQLFKTEGGQTVIKGLNHYRADTYTKSLQLLMYGEANRVFASTAMNATSSRSHCVFSVTLLATRPGTDLTRKSKMTLVDLAGSERVSKTHATGQQLKEAMYINVSLHLLEHCINAIADNADHVPFRSTLITRLLEDSFGGSCLTSMLANVSIDQNNIWESLGTCQFAKRVSRIQNKASINEEVDIRSQNHRLKVEIRQLKEELAFYTSSSSGRGPITQSEIERVRKLIQQYVKGEVDELKIDESVIVKQYLIEFRNLVRSGNPNGSFTSPDTSTAQKQAQDPNKKAEEIAELQDRLREIQAQYDQSQVEIEQLVRMIRDSRPTQGDAWTQTGAVTGGVTKSARTAEELSKLGLSESKAKADQTLRQKTPPTAPSPSDFSLLIGTTIQMPGSFENKQTALDWFRSNHQLMKSMEANAEKVKAKVVLAKETGQRLASLKGTLFQLRETVERLRVEKAMQGIDDNQTDDRTVQEEARKVAEFNEVMNEVQTLYTQLNTLRDELGTLKVLQETTKTRIENDFERYWQIGQRSRERRREAGLGETHSSAALSETSSTPTKTRSTRGDSPRRVPLIPPAQTGTTPQKAKPIISSSQTQSQAAAQLARHNSHSDTHFTTSSPSSPNRTRPERSVPTLARSSTPTHSHSHSSLPSDRAHSQPQKSERRDSVPSSPAQSSTPRRSSTPTNKRTSLSEETQSSIQDFWNTLNRVKSKKS